LQDPSGISMALLPKKTRGSSIAGSMTFRFGNLQGLKNRGTAAGLAGSMLLRGTTRRTRQQIQDELDRLKSRLTIRGSATQANASFETERENLPGLMRLIAEVLLQPAFPANEFELLKQEELASIEQTRSDPDAVANNRLYKHLSPYPKEDPRYTESPDETIAALKATTLEDVQKFYKDFYGASNAQIALVGDFDDTEVSALLKELFGDWKSPDLYERLREEYQRIAPINESLPTPDKTNAVFVAGMNLNIREDDPDYPALYFANYMLGGAMNSRLALRIREKEGLSYGVGSWISAHPLDRSGSFEAYAIFAPQNAAKVESTFREELDKAIKNGFTKDELNIAKAGLIQARQVSRAQDRELVRKLSLYLFLDRKMTWDQQFEEKLQALTPELVTQTFRKYIHPDEITIVKAGDFDNASAK
ncbi:MAG: M16 family metallopeptidase, partial [Acidobacteriota bacterium]